MGKVVLSMKEKKSSTTLSFVRILVPIILVIVLLATIVSVVNYITAPIIKNNEENSFNNALKQIFPEATEFEDVFMNIDDTSSIPNVVSIYKVYKDSDLIGYCTEVYANGFNTANKIDMLVGSDIFNKVTQVVILDNNETPGIGDEILKNDSHFINQFTGLTSPIEFSATVNAVTGATYTSEGVLNGINEALKSVNIVRIALDKTMG